MTVHHNRSTLANKMDQSDQASVTQSNVCVVYTFFLFPWHKLKFNGRYQLQSKTLPSEIHSRRAEK